MCVNLRWHRGKAKGFRQKFIGPHAIQFAQQGWGQARHLAAHDGKAGSFKPIEHVAHVVLGHTVWLKDDECSLHISGPPYF